MCTEQCLDDDVEMEDTSSSQDNAAADEGEDEEEAAQAAKRQKLQTPLSAIEIDEVTRPYSAYDDQLFLEHLAGLNKLQVNIFYLCKHSYKILSIFKRPPH